MKATLKSWEAIIEYARERAQKSLKRKDPIAFAYWRETELFAEDSARMYRDPATWAFAASECVLVAKGHLETQDFMKAALWYSRAKWFVIIGRANGMVMNPKKTGVNLEWLAAEKGVKRALPRLVAASH